MRVLIYGDIGGSGGYYGHLVGILGSGHWPEDWDSLLVCGEECAKNLGPLDPCVRVTASLLPGSAKRAHRYLWHLVIHPWKSWRFRPDLVFFPSGNVRRLWRSYRSVAMCQNLLPYDDAEIARYAGTSVHDSYIRHRRVQSRKFRRADGVIFLSRHSQAVVSGQVGGIRSSAVIPHGLDDDFRLREPRPYSLGDSVRLVYVSPTYFYKRQCEVVKGVAEARRRLGLDVRLRLVGGYDNLDAVALRCTIEEHGAGDYVEIVPFVPRASVQEELLRADVFIWASTCECFPQALLEAMGMRLPICCSDRAGHREILGDAGVYFDPDEPGSIAAALQQLIEDMELRTKCGERAYHYALEYSWKRCAKETAAYLREIAGR